MTSQQKILCLNSFFFVRGLVSHYIWKLLIFTPFVAFGRAFKAISDTNVGRQKTINKLLNQVSQKYRIAKSSLKHVVLLGFDKGTRHKTPFCEQIDRYINLFRVECLPVLVITRDSVVERRLPHESRDSCRFVSLQRPKFRERV